MTQLGVFQIGRMTLGLPALDLREVVPCSQLCAIPSDVPNVVGGINVRGQIIPVVDLNRLLSQSDSNGYQVVLIMHYCDSVLGMLADEVKGFIEIEDLPDDGAHGRPEQLMVGSFASEEYAAVHLLSLAHLFSCQSAPVVRDLCGKSGLPESEAADGLVTTAKDGSRHMMVVRSGGLVMALDSNFVHSTVPCPELLDSALQGDYCVGAMVFEGRRIAAVELANLLGFADKDLKRDQQAFVVELAGGMIACLVEEIVDVIRMKLPAALPVPRFALPRPEFVSGMYSADVIASHEALCSKCHAAYLFELSGEAIYHDESLQGLARMNVGHSDEEDKSTLSMQSLRVAHDACQVVCYDIGYEVATPMSQIIEILPWRPEVQIFGPGHRPDGIVVSRGYVVPTYELCSVLGEPSASLGSEASILVVETDTQRLGFVVPRLLAIDQAFLPAQVLEGEDASRSLLRDVGSGGAPVRIGAPDDYRLLGMIDLQRLAMRLGQAKFNEPPAPARIFAS